MTAQRCGEHNGLVGFHCRFRILLWSDAAPARFGAAGLHLWRMTFRLHPFEPELPAFDYPLFDPWSA